MQERNLKVRKGSRDYYLKSRPHAGNPTIPLIVLKGTWLEEAGFLIDLPICVHVTNGRLVIKPRNGQLFSSAGSFVGACLSWRITLG